MKDKCSCNKKPIGKIEETKGKFKRMIAFSVGHVCEGMNKENPQLSEGWTHGIGSVRIWFVLKGPKGAVQLVISTDMYPKEANANKIHHSHSWGVDLGYHAYKPQHEGQEIYVKSNCEFLAGKPCYYDGSVMNAERPYEIFVKEGLEALWKFLEGEHEILK